MRALMRIRVLLVFTLAATACAQRQESNAALSALVQAERDFAKASVTHGIQHAFLSYLADSATVFRPHPINAKPWYEKLEDAPVTLNWYPIYADISQAGDLGYTTGPWEMTDKSPQKRPPAYGHYFSVWKKQNDGAWKVVVDLGIRQPAPATKLSEDWNSSGERYSASRRALQESRPVAEREALLRSDHAFAQASETQGHLAAVQEYVNEDARWYRQNNLPIIGKENIGKFSAEHERQMTWKPSHVEVANSADLGYTIGSYELKREGNATEKGYYVRMWKRGEKKNWEVVLEVTSPLPASE